VVAPPDARPSWNHLKEDVRLAQELAIRYADSVAGRMPSDTHRQAHEACTNRSFQEIMRRHQVSRAQIAAAIGARELWIDVVLVIAPMLVLFGVASRIIMQHIFAGFDPEDWVIALAIVLLLTPIVAFAGVGVAQIWAVLVEEYRLRSNHISYRAAYLPLYVYKEVAWTVAGALFLATAVRVRRASRSDRNR
jgi:hypothetical protein